MNIKNTFLSLTRKTYPHGFEDDVIKLLPSFLLTDEYGNLFYEIGENNSVMFTSHLDTADSLTSKNVKHIIDKNIIKTDGTTILGADDKAGVTIMLFMIENNVPGLYYFFLGEERGCIGSRKVAKNFKENYPNIDKIVSFDRRGNNSIITHQSYGRCCSDDFANELASELNKGYVNMQKDNTGILTDSAQFMSFISECTNISVGYRNEHTSGETQDILHLIKLCYSVIKFNWNNLKAHRDASVTESRYYGNYATYDNYYDDTYHFYDHYHDEYRDTNFSYRNNKNYERIFSGLPYEDDDGDDLGEITINSYNNDYIEGWDIENSTYCYINNVFRKIYISDDRINDEYYKIYKILKGLDGYADIEYHNFDWNGDELKIYIDNELVEKMNRKELSQYNDSFDVFYGNEIRFNIEKDINYYNEFDEIIVSYS